MGRTWDLDPDYFLLRVFFLDFFFSWGLVLADRSPPPPLEWTSFPPLVTAVLITTKCCDSPGSHRIGVKVFNLYGKSSFKTGVLFFLSKAFYVSGASDAGSLRVTALVAEDRLKVASTLFWNMR